MEDWFGLTTKTGLLRIVATLSLGVKRILALLVLSDFVKTVLSAGLGDTERFTGLGDDNLRRMTQEND